MLKLSMRQVRIHAQGRSNVPVIDGAEISNLVAHGLRMRLNPALVCSGSSSRHRIGYSGSALNIGVVGFGKIRKPNVIRLESAVNVFRHGADVVRVARVFRGEISPELKII